MASADAASCDADGSTCSVSERELRAGAWNRSLSSSPHSVWLSGAPPLDTVGGDDDEAENASVLFRLIPMATALPSLQTAHPFVIEMRAMRRSDGVNGSASVRARGVTRFNVTVCVRSQYSSTDNVAACDGRCAVVCALPKDCFAASLMPSSPSQTPEAREALSWRCLNLTAPWFAREPIAPCIDNEQVLPLPSAGGRLCGEFELVADADVRLAVLESAGALDRLQRTTVAPTSAPQTADNLIVIVVGLVALVFCVSMLLTALFVVYRRKKSTLNPTHLVKIVSEDGTVLYIDADLHNNPVAPDTGAGGGGGAGGSESGEVLSEASLERRKNHHNHHHHNHHHQSDEDDQNGTHRSSSRSPRRPKKSSSSRSASKNAGAAGDASTSGALPVVDDGWLLDYSSFEMKHHLGAGAFGDVSLAEMADGTPVAVKRLLPPDVNVLQTPQQAVEAFFKESLLMQQLPAHRNVIRLIGVCTQPMCIVTEYCEGGSLDRWVRQHEPDLKQVLVMSIDVAHGLQHLHQHNIIHRDLAARNLLMTVDNVIRVADFGLARDTNKDGYQTRAEQGPLKWMAPESIEKQRYSRASDTWAYGVTVWELLSRSTPWPELSPTQACVAVITKNLRLERPARCPVEVFEFLQACWRSEPADRITVNGLIAGFSERLADLLRGDDEEDASVVGGHSTIGTHATIKLPLPADDNDDDDDADSEHSVNHTVVENDQPVHEEANGVSSEPES
jgi:serine/threonine protein kinase